MNDCLLCYRLGFCRRWLVVSDDEILNRHFVLDVRNYVYELGVSPGRVLDHLLNTVAHFDGEFRNAAGFQVDLNCDVFEPSDKDIDRGRYTSARETIRDWFFYNFGRHWPDDIHPNLHGIGRERFRTVATIVRLVHWNDTRVRMWGVRPANDR